MRIIIIVLFFTIAVSASAQTALPVSSMDYSRQTVFDHSGVLHDSSGSQKKWSVSIYSGIGAGLGFFNNGTTAFIPASIGLQLNRRLNNNLYAFVGASAAPAFFYAGHSFSNTDQGNNFMTTPGFSANGWGINTGIRAGLLYVNEAKTFSISGSIGVSNSSYPFYQASQKQPAVIGKRQ